MATQIYFIGAGPGDPELLTIKGKRIIEQADVIIYADSLINSSVCSFAQNEAEVYKSASLNLDEITEIILSAVKQGKIVARLQSGDPSIYGAISEQIAILEEHGIQYEIVPGVSSIFAAAASIKAELTMPELSQTLIITRAEGKTAVPPKERLNSLARHQATLAIFLSISLIDKVVEELIDGGYAGETPVVVIHRASWDDEVVIRATLNDIAQRVHILDIKKQALILVGKVLDSTERKDYRSKLYNKDFNHTHRQG